MDYEHLTDDERLKIVQQQQKQFEAKHLLASLELQVAERVGEPERLRAAQEAVRVVEKTLDVLKGAL